MQRADYGKVSFSFFGYSANGQDSLRSFAESRITSNVEKSKGKQADRVRRKEITVLFIRLACRGR
jgi:hypothetical protein